MHNENSRVKLPVTAHMLRLGYKYISLKDQRIDQVTNIFIDIFREQLSLINGREIGDAEFEDTLREIRKVIDYNDSGKEFYNWLINPNSRLKLIDFKNIENNTFHVANELTFGDDIASFRPDINIIVNGLPLAFYEVKKPNNEGGIQEEFDRMVKYRLVNPEFKRYFNIIQITGFSNNMPYIEINSVDNEDSMEKRQGSFYSTPNGTTTEFNYFREEEKDFVEFKELKEEEIREILIDNKYEEIYETPEFETNLQIDRPANSFATSIFSQERFLFILKYGIMYADRQKHIMRYPQFFASRNIINRIKEAEKVGKEKGEEIARPLKRGIVWHTQGSGKTALSAYVSRILQDYFSEKGRLSRNYFVVDRLGLAKQAKDEFEIRGFSTNRVNSREEFTKELQRPIPINRAGQGNEMTIVNIQKIVEQEESITSIGNHYDADVQRIVFIDEAHRSYSNGGSFLSNLMTIDPDAIYIALTGTPILSASEKSSLKFGEYYHKYFYDKSIADGYTLKIKIEPVETAFKEEVRRNFEIEEDTLKNRDVLVSDNYVNLISKYIENDFTNFRYWTDDKTLGGMIVCKHKEQAQKMQTWFENNSKFKTALVLDNTENNEEKQSDFRKVDKNPYFEKYDLLIVQYMLTTGYDVKRLKKMYMLRKPDKHTLLQTISRVNRPYTKPNLDGKDIEIKYPYGYLMDFAGIEENYENSIKAYTKELEKDVIDPEELTSLSNLAIDSEDINKKYLETMEELKSLIELDNKEEFSIQLMRNNSREFVLKIKKLLERIKICYTEFAISNRMDLRAQIDINHIKDLNKEVQNRLNFLNLLERPVQQIKADWLSNEEIVKIVFQFIKLQSYVLDIGKFIEENSETGKKIKNIIKEVEKNKNSNSPRMVRLDQELKRVLKSLMMKDIAELNSKLSKIYNEIQEINRENEELSKELGADFGYVKTYQEYMEQYPNTDSVILKEFLKIAKSSIDRVIVANKQMYRRKNIFVATIKETTTIEMLTAGIFNKLDINSEYDRLLSMIYNNVNLIK